MAIALPPLNALLHGKKDNRGKHTLCTLPFSKRK
jgi:hypothetical protein